VEQVAQFKWLVLSSKKNQKYVVKRLIEDCDDDNDDEIEKHQEGCKFCPDDADDMDWSEDDEHNNYYGGDPYEEEYEEDDDDAKEDFCVKCRICCAFYNCSCPDEHGICKHIHKVHTMTKRVILPL